VALFGRKINQAEHQLAFIEMLRLITDGRVDPDEAVRAYHGILQSKRITPKRPLEQDLQLTDQAMSYGGGTTTRVQVPGSSPTSTRTTTPRIQPATDRVGDSATSPASDASEHAAVAWPTHSDGSPDFARMTSPQRQAFDVARLKRRFG
jgi:hypothetical protein